MRGCGFTVFEVLMFLCEGVDGGGGVVREALEHLSPKYTLRRVTYEVRDPELLNLPCLLLFYYFTILLFAICYYLWCATLKLLLCLPSLPPSLP